MATDAEALTIADPAVLAHPTALYRALRELRGVHRDPQLNLYLVARHEDIQTVLQDPITFSARLGFDEPMEQGFGAEMRAIIERDGGGTVPNVVLIDPPEHTRIRSLTSKAFTAHRMKLLEPAISELVVDLVESIADAGRCDGMTDFAIPITISVICAQLGFEQIDVDRIHRWTAASTAGLGRLASRDEMLVHAREICDQQNYMAERIRERQQAPREDMVSDLVHARLDDGSTLTFLEVMSITKSLLTAGNETTTTAMGNMLCLFATRPDLAEQAQVHVDDDRWLNRFVEELLRIEPPVRGMPRMTTREVELGGTVLPEGAQMLLLFAAGNDDESVFATPRDFDMERRNIMQHVSFGGGVHRCIGAALARTEIKIATREVARRLRDIALAVPVEELRYLPTVATRTLGNLPLTFARR